MKLQALLVLTLIATGRAMTLAYVGSAGRGGIGDAPAGWTVALLGDAVIGVTAPFVAWIIWKRRSALAWGMVVVWHALALWDALAAYVVHVTIPWPSFFMIELFGSSMFFGAALMHGAAIALACHPDIMGQFVGLRHSSPVNAS